MVSAEAEAVPEVSREQMALMAAVAAEEEVAPTGVVDTRAEGADIKGRAKWVEEATAVVAEEAVARVAGAWVEGVMAQVATVAAEKVLDRLGVD